MERLSYLEDHIDVSSGDDGGYMSMVGTNDMRLMISEFIEEFEDKRFNKKKKSEDSVSYVGTVYNVF